MLEGETVKVIAIEAAIGRKVDVVAVLDVSSVKKMIKVTIKRTKIQGLRLIAKINASPNH